MTWVLNWLPAFPAALIFIGAVATFALMWNDDREEAAKWEAISEGRWPL